jgi:crotonobetainyl-CoA:carnitine CoA-transferase CaiB-like acyl-CoA transferase
MNSASDISTLHPLSGVRVITIALNLPGPACVRRLADFGATVIKVEPPDSLGSDPMRTYAPSYYEALHEGIDVLALNLKDTDDRSTFDGLLASADVFVTAQRGAALEKLQLAGDALSTSFSRVCHIEIVGEEGSEAAGHDLTYLADAGLATPPHLPATLLADLAGAERAVTATFAALRLAQLTGRGQHIVVSLGLAARAFAGPMTHGLTSPGGLLSGAHPGYNFYRASDGWVVLAALEPHFVERVKSASGTKFAAENLQQFFAQKTIAEWKTWASAHDIPLSVISDSSSA